MNWNSGQHDVHFVKFWRQTSGNSFNQRDPSASCLPACFGKYLPLFGFISFHNGLIRCRSTINAYVITWNIISPQKADTIILHFHVITTVSGRNRSIVSVIVGALVVILNSAVLFPLIGPLIQVLCSRSRLRKLPFITVD